MRLSTAVSSCVLFAAMAVPAQQPFEAPIIATFQRISQHAGRLAPMLAQVRSEEWVAKGAPDTYVAQLASTRRQLDAIVADMSSLSARPEQMQECMKGLFRIQAFHRSLDSLMGGLRKYQNPALADLIQSVAAEDQSDLDQIQTWVLDLANEKEQEYKVVDREAQRCRAILSKDPAPKKR